MLFLAGIFDVKTETLKRTADRTASLQSHQGGPVEPVALYLHPLPPVAAAYSTVATNRRRLAQPLPTSLRELRHSEAQHLLLWESSIRSGPDGTGNHGSLPDATVSGSRQTSTNDSSDRKTSPAHASLWKGTEEKHSRVRILCLVVLSCSSRLRVSDVLVLHLGLLIIFLTSRFPLALCGTRILRDRCEIYIPQKSNVNILELASKCLPVTFHH